MQAIFYGWPKGSYVWPLFPLHLDQQLVKMYSSLNELENLLAIHRKWSNFKTISCNWVLYKLCCHFCEGRAVIHFVNERFPLCQFWIHKFHSMFPIENYIASAFVHKKHTGPTIKPNFWPRPPIPLGEKSLMGSWAGLFVDNVNIVFFAFFTRCCKKIRNGKHYYSQQTIFSSKLSFKENFSLI